MGMVPDNQHCGTGMLTDSDAYKQTLLTSRLPEYLFHIPGNTP